MDDETDGNPVEDLPEIKEEEDTHATSEDTSSTAEPSVTTITIPAAKMKTARKSYLTGKPSLKARSKSELVALLIENTVPVTTFAMEKNDMIDALEVGA
jgi:hypothetical protein